MVVNGQDDLVFEPDCYLLIIPGMNNFKDCMGVVL